MYALIIFVWINGQPTIYLMGAAFSEMVCETLKHEGEGAARIQFPGAFVAGKCYGLTK